MNYISAREFDRQSKKVQKTLKEWWKPNFGDLFVNNFDYSCRLHCIENFVGDCFNSKNNKKCDCTPLLQMHHLVQFIEHRTREKINIVHYDNYGYKVEGFQYIYSYNLLETLWKVAIKIIEGED